MPPDTARRIQQVALDLFRQRGFTASSMRDISRGLDLTKASLYYHVRSKDELLEQLTLPVVAELEAALIAVPEGLPPPQQQVRVLAALLDACLRHRAVIQLFFGDVGVRSHPTVGPQVARVAGQYLMRLLGEQPDPARAAAQRVRVHQAMACVRVALELPDADQLRDEVLAGACEVLELPRPA